MPEAWYYHSKMEMLEYMYFQKGCEYCNFWKTISGTFVPLMSMVFNANFNTISVISWRSVLLVEETGVPWENHRPAASYWQTWSHNVTSSTPCLTGIRTHNSGNRHWLTENDNHNKDDTPIT